MKEVKAVGVLPAAFSMRENMILRDILSLRPAITAKAKSPKATENDYEPSVGDILWQYYHDNGLTRAQADKAMDDYIDELQRMIHKFKSA